MKDFAKSIKVNNKTVMDDKGKFIWGYVEKEGDKYVAYTHGITGAKTQLLKADDEKTATEELKDYCRTYWKKIGNSKVGNADPRIASIKQKLGKLADQMDEGGIKDVERLIEDEVKQCQKKMDELYKKINEINGDRGDWLDLRGDVLNAKAKIYFAKKEQK